MSAQASQNFTESRLHRRTGLPASILIVDQSIEIADISMGGTKLKTTTALIHELGLVAGSIHKVQINIHAYNTDISMVIDIRVQYDNPAEGIAGCSFLDMSPEKYEILSLLINAYISGEEEDIARAYEASQNIEKLIKRDEPDPISAENMATPKQINTKYLYMFISAMILIIITGIISFNKTEEIIYKPNAVVKGIDNIQIEAFFNFNDIEDVSIGSMAKIRIIKSPYTSLGEVTNILAREIEPNDNQQIVEYAEDVMLIITPNKRIDKKYIGKEAYVSFNEEKTINEDTKLLKIEAIPTINDIEIRNLKIDNDSSTKTIPDLEGLDNIVQDKSKLDKITNGKQIIINDDVAKSSSIIPPKKVEKEKITTVPKIVKKRIEKKTVKKEIAPKEKEPKRRYNSYND